MEKNIFEVHTLNQKIKSLLESDFSLIGICVKGEVTSLNKHYTGHYYFKLRDEDGSLLSVTMFSSYTKFAPIDLKNGDQVIITGSINVYVQGGTFSFNARKIELDGLGSYLLELKKLESKLQNEGLFSRKKREIKKLPKRIGVLTALTGAAIHDVTSSIQKRCRTEILIFPCSVQGKEAPKTIIKALNKAYTYDLDLIILTRGGGSKDDLYAFNDEELVRTLFNSPCPTITAVGHSIDTTLVDKVSDITCITPTEAGSNAIISKNDMLNNINQLLEKGKIELINKITYNEQLLIVEEEKLNRLSPINVLSKYKNDLANANDNLNKIINNKVKSLFDKYNLINKQLLFPKYKYNKSIDEFTRLKKELNKGIITKISNNLTRINNLSNNLESLSPSNLLLKGYSFVYNSNDKMIKSIDDIQINDEIKIEVNDGLIVTNVKEKRPK